MAFIITIFSCSVISSEQLREVILATTFSFTIITMHFFFLFLDYISKIISISAVIGSNFANILLLSIDCQTAFQNLIPIDNATNKE